MTGYRSLAAQEKALGENHRPTAETARKLTEKMLESQYTNGYAAWLSQLDVSCGSPRRYPASAGSPNEAAKICARGLSARLHYSMTSELGPDRSMRRPNTSFTSTVSQQPNDSFGLDQNLGGDDGAAERELPRPMTAE